MQSQSILHIMQAEKVTLYVVDLAAASSQLPFSSR